MAINMEIDIKQQVSHTPLWMPPNSFGGGVVGA